MATIHIVGCHHALQSVEVCPRWLIWKDILAGLGKDVGVLAKTQKEKFAERLAQIVKEYHVQLVGEEADPKLVTHGNKLGIKWVPIDMSPETRQQEGIPLDYAGNDAYPEEDRKRWDLRRELTCVLRFCEAGARQKIS